MNNPESITVTEESPAPREPDSRKVSTLANASCIMGILSVIGIISATLQFILLSGIAAIICGHIARWQIRKNHKTAKGSGMALAGLILGYTSVTCILLTWNDRERALNRAKTVTTLATAAAFESAAQSFFLEYNKLPTTEAQVSTDTPSGVSLLNVLLGLEKSDNPENTRLIRFLAISEGKNHKNGLIYIEDRNSIKGLYDPWGNPYTVIIDTDYDEILRFKSGTRNIELKGRRVATYSPGPDRTPGTADDITTW